MKKAFEAKFVLPPEDDISTSNENLNLDEDEENAPSIWENLDDDDDNHLKQSLSRSSRIRISCFTHSLQLVVCDGLSDTRCVSRAIAKMTKLVNLLHRSNV